MLSFLEYPSRRSYGGLSCVAHMCGRESTCIEPHGRWNHGPTQTVSFTLGDDFGSGERERSPSVEVCGLIFFNSDVSDCLVNARQDGALAESRINRSFFVLPNGSIRHCPTPQEFVTLIPLAGMI